MFRALDRASQSFCGLRSHLLISLSKRTSLGVNLQHVLGSSFLCPGNLYIQSKIVFQSLHNIYMYQIITFCTLNFHNVICLLSLNKTRGKKLHFVYGLVGHYNQPSRILPRKTVHGRRKTRKG